MLLRNSVSRTKKFFQKTLHNFKAFFSFSSSDHSSSYKKLPKASPFYDSFSPGIDMSVAQTSVDYQELDKFYSDFKDQWDKEMGKKIKNSKKTQISVPRAHEQVYPKPKFSPVKDRDLPATEKTPYEQRSVESAGERQSNSGSSKAGREAKSLMVVEKLKELEMVDKSNVDHVLDIEEVLHYYSRLTCPFYVDIIDKFFMEVVEEFSGPAAISTPRSVNSRPLSGTVKA